MSLLRRLDRSDFGVRSRASRLTTISLREPLKQVVKRKEEQLRKTWSHGELA